MAMVWNTWRLGWAGLLGMWCGLAAADPQTFDAVASHVSDGDTLWVKPLRGGDAVKLRLQGLDAPEICQAGGDASRQALALLVSDNTVQVTLLAHDSYGRGLARLTVQGQDVGAALVLQGHAWSSRWHKTLGPYARQEAQARAQGQGVFADSAPEMPADFRKRRGSCYPPQGTQ